MKFTPIQNTSISIGAIAAALVVLASGTASAQSSQSWRGFYLGLNAGGAWSESAVSNRVCDSGSDCYFSAPSGFAGYGQNVNAAGSGNMDAASFTGGIQIGYNAQFGNVVAGVEADLNLLDLGISRTVAASGGPSIPAGTLLLTDRLSSDYLGTVRGRLGFTTGPAMIYVTGGLAYTKLKHSFSANETGVGVGCSDTTNYCDIPGSSTLRTGWTIGGGAEWALGRNWSVKAEYLYADFGSTRATSDMNRFSVTYGQGQSVIQHEADLTVHMVRAGINYRF